MKTNAGLKASETLTLKQIAQRLDEAGVAWAVFAGAAAAVYGASRPLTDVDILVRATDGQRTATLFPNAHVKRLTDGAVEVIALSSFDLVAGLRYQDADAVYAMDLDDEMETRLTWHDIQGITVPVVPAEDNILLKASWGRGQEQGKHDWEDVEAMLAHLPTLDWEYLRWRAETRGPRQRAGDILDRLISLSDRRLSSPVTRDKD